ncbi:MAG: hypothetical protein HYS13_22865 [Planctomycetia bacterium]|nr:hypothetical protein [Planctomycetia bacterium]
MASVVFLRGVNVGGHKTFKPSAFVKELAHLDAVNVGAAGTFVVRKSIGKEKLRAEILRRLPFAPEIMICPASDLLQLAAEDFQDELAGKDVRRFITILAKRPGKLPRLPIREPDSDQWQVKVVAVSALFALSLWRRIGKRLIYPNEVVEKHFAIPATTRNWNTISALCEILRTP